MISDELPCSHTSSHDLPNAQRHLTNYAINKHAGGGGGVPAQGAVAAGPGPKLGLDEFRSRLAADVGATRAEAAWREVEAALVKTLIAAEPTMGQVMTTRVGHPSGLLSWRWHLSWQSWHSRWHLMAIRWPEGCRRGRPLPPRALAMLTHTSSSSPPLIHRPPPPTCRPTAAAASSSLDST